MEKDPRLLVVALGPFLLLIGRIFSQNIVLLESAFLTGNRRLNSHAISLASTQGVRSWRAPPQMRPL